jgi:hypothetical protein
MVIQQNRFVRNTYCARPWDGGQPLVSLEGGGFKDIADGVYRKYAHGTHVPTEEGSQQHVGQKGGDLSNKIS